MRQVKITKIKEIKMKKIILGLAVVSSLVYADYTRTQAGVVKDNKTHLEWQDNYSDNNGTIKVTSWSNAVKYCHELNLDGGGWRLPNINELKSIIKDRVVGPTIDEVFENSESYNYYSSTTLAGGDSSFFWIVNFSNGNVLSHSNYSYNCNVRCVRAGQ